MIVYIFVCPAKTLFCDDVKASYNLYYWDISFLICQEAWDVSSHWNEDVDFPEANPWCKSSKEDCFFREILKCSLLAICQSDGSYCTQLLRGYSTWNFQTFFLTQNRSEYQMNHTKLYWRLQKNNNMCTKLFGSKLRQGGGAQGLWFGFVRTKLVVGRLTCCKIRRLRIVVAMLSTFMATGEPVSALTANFTLATNPHLIQPNKPLLRRVRHYLGDPQSSRPRAMMPPSPTRYGERARSAMPRRRRVSSLFEEH